MLKYNIGDRYGKLTILSAAPPSDKYKNKRMVLCKCDCGAEVSLPISYLVHGVNRSCGCGRNESRLDLRGKRFGKLVGLEPTGEIRRNSSVWKWQCDCGNVIFATADSVQYGGRTGCGCTKESTQLANAEKARCGQTVIDGSNLCLISTKKVFRNNTSGYKGVMFHKGSQKWVAKIGFKGKVYNLGYFTSKEEAAKARKRAEEELILPFLEENAADFPQYLARFLGKK